MRLKVLLADDSPVFLAAMRQFIDALPGITVVAQTDNGEDALRLARELVPDLVILDITMSGKNGLDVAREMNAWDRPPRILFLSAHESAPYRVAAQETGASGFVGKSEFVEKLMPLLEKLTQDPGSAETHW